MARRIAAHITIAYEAADDPSLQVVLDRVAANAALIVRLTRVECWGSPERGIYLGVNDAEGSIARIRRVLHAADGAEAYIPHVTLVHPRSVPPPRAREAWHQLADRVIDAEVLIDRLVVIESRGSQWQTVATVSLPGR